MEGVDTSAEPAAPKKPALLKGGMVLCWVYFVVLALALLVLPDPDVSNLPIIAGEPLELQRLRQQLEAGAMSRQFLIPLLVISIIVAYGLAKDRYWSRTAMMLLLILGILLTPPGMASIPTYAASAALAGFGWWYLYRKPNVVEYYNAIKQRQLH